MFKENHKQEQLLDIKVEHLNKYKMKQKSNQLKYTRNSFILN